MLGVQDNSWHFLSVLQVSEIMLDGASWPWHNIKRLKFAVRSALCGVWCILYLSVQGLTAATSQTNKLLLN